MDEAGIIKKYFKPRNPPKATNLCLLKSTGLPSSKEKYITNLANLHELDHTYKFSNFTENNSTLIPNIPYLDFTGIRMEAFPKQTHVMNSEQSINGFKTYFDINIPTTKAVCP